ncbi:hypothetical protein [uncultured Rubinisphaera sp.]|uniref:hypothetical protein n=1 Tax=uncultured Rubinisphaera sp. TaxID=1678686 RepID=UPI0030D7FE53
MNQLTITGKVHFQKGKKGRKRLTEGKGREKPQGRLPRVTKLMALAIRFDQLIRDGHVNDYTELARLGQVTRARMTQIMNLLNLAPAIQEAILFLPRVEQGGDPVTERELRDVVGVEDWAEQERLWR